MQLKDKVIIVTGSTTGIGQAIAERCLEHGARVLLHGRDPQRGETLKNTFGQTAAFCQADLADPNASTKIIETAIKTFGRIDGLVNNAAIMARGNLHTTDCQAFDNTLAINLRAPFLLIKAAYPHLESSQGCVLNIGSINGYCGEANQFAYSISKAGLLTLSRNLADAFTQSKVRINHFVVGWVLTENEKKLKISEGLAEDWYIHPPPLHVPSGNMTSPYVIADAAIYWLSDQSRPISGSVIELEQFPMIGRNLVKEGN